MKLIKKLETRQDKNGKWIRYSLFHCDYCSKDVEKKHHQGIAYHSCGCSMYKISSESLTKHGDCKRSIKNKNGNRGKDRLYITYVAMKARCYNVNNKNYNLYGGRGINVCEQWKGSYTGFKKWALNNGYKEGLTIDRIKNDKGYCPENCRFATQAQQVQNSSKAKLNWNSVNFIRKLFKNGLNRKKIYPLFNLSKSQINRIIGNRSWIESEVI